MTRFYSPENLMLLRIPSVYPPLYMKLESNFYRFPQKQYIVLKLLHNTASRHDRDVQLLLETCIDTSVVNTERRAKESNF